MALAQAKSSSSTVTTDGELNSFVGSTLQLESGSPISSKVAGSVKGFKIVLSKDLLQLGAKTLRRIMLINKSQSLKRVIKLSLFSIALTLQIPFVNAKGRSSAKLAGASSCLHEPNRTCRVISYITIGIGESSRLDV
jgi:hypothetical protein